MTDNADLRALKRFMPDDGEPFNRDWAEALHAYVLDQHSAGRTPEDIASDLAFTDDPDIIRKVNQILFGVSDPKNWPAE